MNKWKLALCLFLSIGCSEVTTYDNLNDYQKALIEDGVKDFYGITYGISRDQSHYLIRFPDSIWFQYTLSNSGIVKAFTLNNQSQKINKELIYYKTETQKVVQFAHKKNISVIDSKEGCLQVVFDLSVIKNQSFKTKIGVMVFAIEGEVCGDCFNIQKSKEVKEICPGVVFYPKTFYKETTSNK